MQRSRGSSFIPQEDELLCRVYLEISQDPIVSNNQALRKLWGKIEKSYNEKKNDEWELRSSRSLEGRMSLILSAVRSLKGCVHQVENMHLSGASEQDIMDKAKHLLMQNNIKFKKGFRFDHVWILMKDIPKFTDNVNIGIPETPTAGSDTIGSPTSQSPGLSSFSINLSSEDGGSSSQRPIGSKKAKLKRKMDEGTNSATNSLVSSSAQILDFLKESASSRDKNYELQQLRMQNQSRKLALKEREHEDKILLTNLNSLDDNDSREFIRAEKARIIQKRRQEQQQPPVAQNPYGQYFNCLGGSGSDLPEY